jgi:uncharacterized protein YuzE
MEALSVITGTGYWTYDSEAKAWYFGLNERSAPPYRKQVFLEAIIDLDADGRVAGFEIISGRGENSIKPPLSVFPEGT